MNARAFDHVWRWDARPLAFVGGVFERIPRKGQPCAVTARGALGSVRVEFPDGFTVITSRHAVMPAPAPSPQMVLL